MSTVFIYSLSTLEEPNNIRYIGKANNLDDRLKRHLSSYYLNEGTYKSNWLKSELKQRHNPIINIIDEVSESEWNFWEQYWICQFKCWGFKLTNGTIGGEGIYLNKETILKRNKTNFEKNTIRLQDELIKYNTHKNNEIWISEINCPNCNSLIKYENIERGKTLFAVRRALKESRWCTDCEYKNREGRKNSFFGKKHTKENQEFLKNIAPRKKVAMLSQDNVILKEFSSLREAEKETNIHRNHISRCCRNKPHYLTAGGYKWKFI